MVSLLLQLEGDPSDPEVARRLHLPWEWSTLRSWKVLLPLVNNVRPSLWYLFNFSDLLFIISGAVDVIMFVSERSADPAAPHLDKVLCVWGSGWRREQQTHSSSSYSVFSVSQRTVLPRSCL